MRNAFSGAVEARLSVQIGARLVHDNLRMYLREHYGTVKAALSPTTYMPERQTESFATVPTLKASDVVILRALAAVCLSRCT